MLLPPCDCSNKYWIICFNRMNLWFVKFIQVKLLEKNSKGYLKQLETFPTST